MLRVAVELCISPMNGALMKEKPAILFGILPWKYQTYTKPSAHICLKSKFIR